MPLKPASAQPIKGCDRHSLSASSGRPQFYCVLLCVVVCLLPFLYLLFYYPHKLHSLNTHTYLQCNSPRSLSLLQHSPQSTQLPTAPLTRPPLSPPLVQQVQQPTVPSHSVQQLLPLLLCSKQAIPRYWLNDWLVSLKSRFFFNYSLNLFITTYHFISLHFTFIPQPSSFLAATLC